MLKARAAALAAGILLTLGTVCQAEQADFYVISVDKAAGTIAVAAAGEEDVRLMHHYGDLGSPSATVTLVPKTNYVHSRTQPNADEHSPGGWFTTKEEFLDIVEPGDVLEIDGPVSAPDIIWLQRWQHDALR